METTVLTKANAYLSTINPLAGKIHSDIYVIKTAYPKSEWDQLTYHQQNDIINSSLIRSELMFNYFDQLSPATSIESINDTDSMIDLSVSQSSDGKTMAGKLAAISGRLLSMLTKETAVKSMEKKQIEPNPYEYDGSRIKLYARLRTGDKKQRDDLCGRYRDEHSAPFIMKSNSQIDFNAFDGTPEPTIDHKRTVPIDVVPNISLSDFGHTESSTGSNLEDDMDGEGSMNKVEDDEYKSLLEEKVELKKNYDFLNNW